jgi:hypothetical protein
MERLVLFLALGAAAAGPAFAQEGGEAPAPRTLFTSSAPLVLTLAADFKQVFADRDTTKVEWAPGTITWAAGDSSATMAVELTTRGHFRLKPSTCSTPPIRVRFPKDGKKGTPWQGQGSLKLVTHCRNYDQQVLQEYLIYRAYGLFTDMGFLTRLARVTWADQRDGKTEDHWGFFLEDDDDMAERVGGQIEENQGVSFGIADSTQLALMSVFLYMVGNTDWSLPYLHNVKVISSGFAYYPVPYDFDWSGIVGAPYARPDYRLGIRSVKDRLYRGPCLSPELLDATLDRFIARKAELWALYEGQEGVEDKWRKDSLSYLDEFYKVITDRRRAHRELRGVCPR